MQRLVQACVEGNTERLTSLLDSAMNPRELVNKREEQGFTALHIAVMMGAADCARKLLDAGADPKASTPEGATPIVMAAQGTGQPGAPELQEGGAAKCVQFLLDAGADQTERDDVVGTVPLHTAVYSGRLEVFKTLLAGPGGEVAVNTKDSQGATPLHSACRAKGTTGPVAAMALLEEGCPVAVDVNVRDDSGRTPLFDAAHHGHAEVVKLLLAAGSDPSLQDSSGLSPLSATAWLGKEACLDAILGTERGLATLELTNNLGATPLIFACQENNKDIAKKLIAAGASLDAKDLTGQTPYIIAKAQKASACLELLTEEHGRPSQEEESFNFAGLSVVTNLGGGTLMGMRDGGVTMSTTQETTPDGTVNVSMSMKKTESGTGTAAAPAPAPES
ncbi:unnamed protein product [Ectocarpus sp. 12 AP-2014]